MRVTSQRQLSNDGHDSSHANVAARAYPRKAKNRIDLYSASIVLRYSKALGWPMSCAITRHHTVLSANTFRPIRKWNEQYLPLLLGRRVSPSTGIHVRSAEGIGGRVGLGGLTTRRYRGDRPAGDGHQSQWPVLIGPDVDKPCRYAQRPHRYASPTPQPETLLTDSAIYQQTEVLDE